MMFTASDVAAQLEYIIETRYMPAIKEQLKGYVDTYIAERVETLVKQQMVAKHEQLFKVLADLLAMKLEAK